jgi:coatomer subunit gamma
LENLDLGLVIQEIRVFSETPLKAKKCELVLMKLLYLIYNGTKLSEQDATTVFFAITKTFQSKEVNQILIFCFIF